MKSFNVTSEIKGILFVMRHYEHPHWLSFPKSLTRTLFGKEVLEGAARFLASQ